MRELRPLPRLELPAALLRFSLAGSTGGAFRAAVDAEALPAGVVRLRENLFAVLPTRGRGGVMQIGARLASRLGRLAPAGAAPPGILLFPGTVAVQGERAEVLPDGLFQDLEQHQPELPAGSVVLTGYVAAWLRGRLETAGIDAYEGPSGRRVALHAVEALRRPPIPHRNVRIFGRRVELERPQVLAELEAALAKPALRLDGGLGVGKSRMLHLALGERPVLWVDLEGELPDGATLGPALAAQLGLADSSEPGRNSAGRISLEEISPEETAEEIFDRVRDLRRRQGAVPRLVVEGLSVASEHDRAVVAALLERLDPEVFTFVQVDRLAPRGGSSSGADRSGVDRSSVDLPRVAVPPLDDGEAERFLPLLLAGLEMPEVVAERLMRAGAGHPFALEEGVLDMVQRGLLRRVYGSFFYAGGEDGDYRPSPRLARHVEAAVLELGEALPLRMLASADDAMDAEHLRGACAEFGVELGEQWSRRFVDAGWLRAEGKALRFAVPAHGLALASTLGREGTRSLRHALGGVLATDGAEWTAYRLMAGSPEALPSLLDTSRDQSESAPREELFNALFTEYQEHRQRAGDESTELELLWALLPLARRLGCLGRLGREIRRGIELARGDDQRYVALVALQAEYNQEQGNFRDAEAGLRAALAASAGFEEKRRATLFLRLGVLLHRQQRWSEARDIFVDLAGVADKNGPTTLGATCRFYLGNVALHQRRLESAESHHRKALDFRRERGQRRATGASLCALGAVAIARGDYPSALAAYEEAREILEQVGVEAWERSYALLGAGRASIRLGDLTGGTAHLKRALDARRGREDVIGEAYAHLELALGYLLLDRDAKALEQARRAHFLLSLAPEGAFLGDAERLLGRLCLRQGELQEAAEHFALAADLHRRHASEHAVAEDGSWQLELAMAGDAWRAVERAALELSRQLDALAQPDGGEALFYRLYRGLKWLQQRGFDIGDPEQPLRRAYKELMRKTGFLPTDRRQSFLFQVRVHQDILNEATRYQISLPDVPQVIPAAG